jgi:hypothetical protein
MQRFAVEFRRRTVGVAVRLAGGFVFYASDKDFEGMDGQTFAKARAIERQLRKVAKRRKGKEPRFLSDPAFA